MNLEDLKNSIPETPLFIHEMIQNEVKNQLTSQNSNKKTVPEKNLRY